MTLENGPKRDDLFDLATKIYHVVTGTPPTPEEGARLLAAVDAVQRLDALAPYIPPELRYTARAVVLFEVADKYVKSNNAKRALEALAKSNLEQAGLTEKKPE